MTPELVFHLKAVTEIWTGDADKNNSALQLTGLLGSLRWWCEAVVRGMGGKACDPTNNEQEDGNHRCKVWDNACYVCRLFGFAGGKDRSEPEAVERKTEVPVAARFHIRVSDENPNDVAQWTPRTQPLHVGNEFFLSFWVPRGRVLEPGQKWLLMEATKVICEWGSIGGKTTLKPSNDGAEQHIDYGIVQLLDGLTCEDAGRAELLQQLDRRPRGNGAKLPDLSKFWFVPGVAFINEHPDDGGPKREIGSFNHLVGLDRSGFVDRRRRRPSSPSRPKSFGTAADALRRELRGAYGESGRSKKVFSFGGDAPRTWGYVNDAQLLDLVPDLLREAGYTGAVKYGRDLLS